MRASEVLYGFCGWLTTREEPTIMSRRHDAAVVADRIKEFIDSQGLQMPRDNYVDDLAPYPKEKE